MNSAYSDSRSAFFQRYYASALPYQAYVGTGEPGQINNVRNYEARMALTPSQQQLLGSFTRRMQVLVLSGLWCGDCTRQIPLLDAIERACPPMEVRYLDSRSHPEMQEELRINGALKVPVVVVLSEDFFELARFGDRHLSVYRRLAAANLGISCDTGLIPPPEEELSAELAEWVLFFERLQLMLRLAPLLRQRYGD